MSKLWDGGYTGEACLPPLVQDYRYFSKQFRPQKHFVYTDYDVQCSSESLYKNC